MPRTSKLFSRPLRTAVFLATLCVVIGMVGGLASGSAKLSAHTTEHGYVTTALALPMTRTDYARDIDGNGSRDNRLGSIFGALAAQGLNLQASVDEAIASGDLLMLDSLRTPSLANTKDASWQVLYAEPTPAPDFSGSGSFTVDGSVPHSGRLPATISNHHVKTAAGNIPLRLDLGNGDFPIMLEKGKVFATCSKSACSSGRINGAITAQDVDTKLIPDLAETFSAIVARDCPGPGPASCMADTEGKTLQQLFDPNDDLVITADEMRDSSLIQNVLAPDLDLVKANGKPGHDGVKDALSAGFGFESVRAKF